MCVVLHMLCDVANCAGIVADSAASCACVHPLLHMYMLDAPIIHLLC
jgi:hypothetical protein